MNTFLFTNINENRLQLNSLFTLATAQVENVENGEAACDLCVVKKKRIGNRPDEIVFSCRYFENSSCSKDHKIGSVFCNKAKECN